jgi:hypothetical protein
MPVEAEMCEYVVQWPSQFACPLDESEKADSQSRLPSSSAGSWFGWALSWGGTIGCIAGYSILYRDDVRDSLLSSMPPAAAAFFADPQGHF